MDERRKMPYELVTGQDNRQYVISASYNDVERRSGEERRVNLEGRRFHIIEETRAGDEGFGVSYHS